MVPSCKLCVQKDQLKFEISSNPLSKFGVSYKFLIQVNFQQLSFIAVIAVCIVQSTSMQVDVK